MEDKRQRMLELVELLNRAGKAYYQGAEEIMSNQRYCLLYTSSSLNGKINRCIGNGVSHYGRDTAAWGCNGNVCRKIEIFVSICHSRDFSADSVSLL